MSRTDGHPAATGHPDLRADLVEIYGLDEGCSDDAIRIAARMHLDTASCDTCAHLTTAHEPDDYDADGTPSNPICCVPACKCGSQWRTS